MAPPVDSANQANSASVDTSEMCSTFNMPERMMAAAWQQIIGINKRSKMSHGKSWPFDTGTSEDRRNEPRLNEPRRNDTRRIIALVAER